MRNLVFICLNFDNFKIDKSYNHYKKIDIKNFILI